MCTHILTHTPFCCACCFRGVLVRLLREVCAPVSVLTSMGSTKSIASRRTVFFASGCRHRSMEANTCTYTDTHPQAPGVGQKMSFDAGTGAWRQVPAHTKTHGIGRKMSFDACTGAWRQAPAHTHTDTQIQAPGIERMGFDACTGAWRQAPAHTQTLMHTT